MKQPLFFLFFFFIAQLTFTQNLVPNPSFEDTIFCPGGGAILGAKSWYPNENTPDYFNECSTYQQLSVPTNRFGFQWPSTGNAYIGLYNYSTVDNYRESVGTYLTTPLEVGKKYFVTFKVSFTFNIANGSNIATNNIGMLFTTGAYTSSPPPRDNFCQINQTNIVSDTTNWTTVQGSFIADSSYQFISISNFFDSSHTDTMLFYQNNWYQSYYYIDDVCVSPDSIFAQTWTNLPNTLLSNTEISLYPNPTLRDIEISGIPLDCIAIKISDITGKTIKMINHIFNRSVNFDTNKLPNGVYFVIFSYENKYTYKTFIKLNN